MTKDQEQETKMGANMKDRRQKAEKVRVAMEALPDSMSNSEIAALFMTIATAYRVDKDDLVGIFGAMLQAIGAGHYDLALAGTDDGEEDEE